MDKEKKGYLTSPDLSKSLEQFSKEAKCSAPDKDKLQKLMEKYDVNKDKKVDPKEFTKMATELFNIQIVSAGKVDSKNPSQQNIDEHKEQVPEVDEATKERRGATNG